jgi:two-component system, chemotaxis family, sensor kinase CheA
MTDPNGFSPDDLEILLPIYRSSASEYIESARRALETVRVAPEDAEAAAVLHRAAHSLKGASLQLGFVHVGILAQAMEALARVGRTCEGGIPTECIELFVRGADCLEGYLRALDSPTECPDADGRLLSELEAMTARLSAETAGTGSAGTR